MFRYSDNCIWIDSCKFSQSWTGYLPFGVNVLTNTVKIFSNTSGDIFLINFTENDKKTWSKRSQGNLARISHAFIYWLPKLVLKRCSWESFLTKIITVCNLGNMLAMTIIFSFKMFKISRSIDKWNKNWEKVFRFSDNCIWIGSWKFSQPWTVYLPSAVNVLTNIPKISFNTRGEIFQINFTQNDKQTW